MIAACSKEPPSVVTLSVTKITDKSAMCSGSVTDEGQGSVVARGFIWGENDPTLESNAGFISSGTGTGLFSCQITNLEPYTDYIVRSFASSEYGTSYGDPQRFQTLAKLAIIQTTVPYDITITGATTGGTIFDSGGTEIIARGVYVGTTNSPETSGTKISAGSGSGSFTVTLSDLLEETVYYVKAFAVNMRGESLGGLTSFTTGHTLSLGPILYNSSLTYGWITDIDGNIYKTIVIGTQTWMANDLRTTRYNDGRRIRNVTSNSEWTVLTRPAYCWYDNNYAYKDYFGALYNWYVIDSGNICPAGWHIPSDNEWTILANYLGGSTIAGAAVKEAGTTHWVSPNTGATNSSGFTSLPGGSRNDADGSFVGLFTYETMWSSTEYNELKPYYRSTSANNTELWRGFGGYKKIGKSMRCVKD